MDFVSALDAKPKTRQTMKKTIIAGAAAVALAAPAYAELEGDISVTYNSQYGFRGLSDALDELYTFANSVTPIVGDNTQDTYEANLNLAWKLNDSWSIVGGGNVHTVSDADMDHNRHHLGIRYTNECYTIELGWQHHDIRTGISDLVLPGFGDWNTQEIYARISTQCPLTGGNVTLFAAHDFDTLDGTYVELSLNKAWEICERCKVDVTAGVSYSFGYWDEFLQGPLVPNGFDTGSDWNNAYLNVAYVIQATENLTIAPYVRYSTGFDALDAGASAGPLSGIEEDDEVIFGVNASVKF